LHTSSFYFYSSRYHLYLHSFPTRRSSDLIPADLLIRDSLLRLGLNHDLVVIGIGKETFRDSNKHVSGGDQYQNAECQRQRTVAQHPLQSVIVNIQHPVEDPLGRSQQPSWIGSMCGGLQES